MKRFFFYPLIVLLLSSLPYFILKQYPDVRHRWFTFLMTTLIPKEGPMQEIRCNLLSTMEGDLVEFGAGTGPNFACMKESDEKGLITSYTAIDPNQYFHEHLRESHRNHSLTFPIDIKGLAGEKVPIESNSKDVVILTHVLCSVSDTGEVLKEAYRILKPGGKIYFLEHTADRENAEIRKWQEFIRPIWKIFFDGCDFIETWKYFDTMDEKGMFENIEYKYFNAPMPFALVEAHIMGVATKTRGPI